MPDATDSPAYCAVTEDFDDRLRTELNRQANQNDIENYARTMSRAVDAKCGYFPGHSDCVAFICTFLANRLGLDQDFLRLCAMFHDVGKLLIPTELLTRPGTLTPEEFGVVQAHATFGESLLLAAERPDIAEVVRSHHERWDGSGYPDGLMGEAIPLHARIVHVADAYAVMVIDRTYKAPIDGREAMLEIERCAGKQFDPTVAEAMTGGR